MKLIERLELSDYDVSELLTREERKLLEAILCLSIAKNDAVSSKELADKLGYSRKQVKKTRASLSKKINILKPGF